MGIGSLMDANCYCSIDLLNHKHNHQYPWRLGKYMDEQKKEFVIKELNKIIEEIKILIPSEVFNFDDFYIAGGCIYSLYNGKEPKDYDIFCKNKKAIKRLLKYLENNKDKCSFVTDNAISLGKFQFIIRFIGNPKTQVSKFDFKHNMFYYDGKDLVCLSEWKYLESNTLSFNSTRARDVLNILSRIPKFIERGMEISQREIYEILEVGTRPTNYFRERASIKKFRKGKYKY